MLLAIDRVESADPIESPEAEEIVEKRESFLAEERRPVRGEVEPTPKSPPGREKEKFLNMFFGGKRNKRSNVLFFCE